MNKSVSSTKRCSECGIVKNIDNYYYHHWTKDNRMHMCIECHAVRTESAPRGIGTPEERRARTSRNTQLKSDYGINIDEYEAMEKSQNYSCKICGGKQTDGRGLAVDHCHSTGKIRGLLCSKCNRALGGFNDDPELLDKAKNYLLEN